MKIVVRALGMWQTNFYLLINETTNQAVAVDPGYGEMEILDIIQPYQIEAILLTHAHLDHIGGLKVMKEKTSAPIYIHKQVKDWLVDPAQNMSDSFPGGEPLSGPPADHLLHDGDKLALAGFVLEVRHTPGHTPGCVSYVVEGEGIVFSGDALFRDSVGRTDFPGGSFDTLERSIVEKLYTLPDSTVVLPGHGPQTTIGHEKMYNPFVNVSS